MFALFRGPEWIAVPASLADATDCASLHAAGFARGWSAEEFEDLLGERAVLADMLVDRNKRRAPAAGFALSRFAAGEAELCSIAVSPALRGKGGGALLLSAHLARLATLGVSRVTLEVDQGNASARRLYARFGFAEVGRRPGYYQSGRAGGMALVLARALEPVGRPLYPEMAAR